MDLYLYLERKEYARTWAGGGIVPLRPVSAYRSIERHQTFTPDEVIQRGVWGMTPSQVDFLKGMENIHFGPGVFAEIDGFRQPLSGSISYHEEDALVLCFSRIRSRSVCERLGKKVAVKIIDHIALIDRINDQLGVEAKFDFVEYTKGKTRNHFMKSMEDSWQSEARAIWIKNPCKETFVEVPVGIAERINIKDLAPEVSNPIIDHCEYDRCMLWIETGDDQSWRPGMPIIELGNKRRIVDPQIPMMGGHKSLPDFMKTSTHVDNENSNRKYRRKNAKYKK